MQQNSPGRAPSELVKPGRNADVPNDLPSIMRCPESHRNGCEAETVMQSRDTGPGGAEGEEVESRSAEADRTRGSDGDEFTNTQGRPTGDGDERYVDTKAQRQVPGRGGQVEVQDRSDDIEGDWSHGIDGFGDGYDGTRGRMDGATSGARRKSKRLGTRSLAIERQGQRGRHDHNTAHVPGPSTAST